MKIFLLSVLILFFGYNIKGIETFGYITKGKYQYSETINENPPGASLHGTVKNIEQQPLQGASVIVAGTRFGINTNEDGQYILTGLPAGMISIMVSYVGYQTSIIDFNLQVGNNYVNFTLESDDIALEAITVTSQHREQQKLDIPGSISILSRRFIETANILEMGQFADFIPGMNARVQTPHRPTFVIRGLSSDEVSPAAQPRISTYFNRVPVSRASMAIHELYDMERVEVLKGPQGTLFGRGAQVGAINFITRKPKHQFGGYITSGMGNFGHRELQGAVNLPVVENKLLFRVAGIYNYRNGFVENTYGGTLNGKNTSGGRFSARFLPYQNTKIDLVVNYQRENNPGTAFMSKMFPNANMSTDIFQYQASLEQGENLHNKRDVLVASLDMRQYLDENNFFSSITSVINNSSNSRWDGDGTRAPAIDMAESVKVDQFSQEVRYNFSVRSNISGFLGASYWRENVKQLYWFGPNEQHMAYLFLQMPHLLIAPDGNAYPITNLPNNPALGPLAGMPLPVHHEEENRSSAINQALDFVADATWRLAPGLSFTGGLRATREQFKVGNESMMTAGSPSVLGFLTGSAPNLFFRPVAFTEVRENFLSLTWRANLKYDFNSYSNVFLGYARGRRPEVIQFDREGNSETMSREIVHSFDAGFKWSAIQGFWFDAGVFYQLYSNFQTTTWDQTEMNYLIKDAGKATSFGLETTVRAAILGNLDIFGNYAWINATFDDTDSYGNPQEYAGNSFRLTPEHSFAVGFAGNIKLTDNLNAFLVPTYTFKSHVWFEDANTPNLYQGAYGLINGRVGLEFTNLNLTFALTGRNLLNEQYVISAGNTGAMFGVPTFIPGAPRMLGFRATMVF